MPTAREKRESLRQGFAERILPGVLRFAAAQLAVAGWLAMTLPSAAQNVSSSYRNDFRRCAARLLSVEISNDAAATACAAALRPQNLSTCVLQIKQRTTIAAENALSTCKQVRRPEELSRCVVGISRNSQEESVPGVLDYCGRSLLPVRFAECVVGLRRATEFAPNQAMDTCISATDLLPPRDFSPTFVPQTGTPPVQPTLTPQPGTPSSQPAPTPTGPQNQTGTPSSQPTLTPIEPQNQTPPDQLTPAPTTPANPGAQ